MHFVMFVGLYVYLFTCLYILLFTSSIETVPYVFNTNSCHRGIAKKTGQTWGLIDPTYHDSTWFPYSVHKSVEANWNGSRVIPINGNTYGPCTILFLDSIDV